MFLKTPLSKWKSSTCEDCLFYKPLWITLRTSEFSCRINTAMCWNTDISFHWKQNLHLYLGIQQSLTTCPSLRDHLAWKKTSESLESNLLSQFDPFLFHVIFGVFSRFNRPSSLTVFIRLIAAKSSKLIATKATASSHSSSWIADPAVPHACLFHSVIVLGIYP